MFGTRSEEAAVRGLANSLAAASGQNSGQHPNARHRVEENPKQ